MKGTNFNPLATRQSTENLNGVLDFYTSFANPAKASFSWDQNLPNAFELFAQGKLAYFFGYNYHADELRARGLQFDWDITNFLKPKEHKALNILLIIG